MIKQINAQTYSAKVGEWKETILWSINLGLGGAGSCRCSPDGLRWPGTSYADRAGGSAAGSLCPLRGCLAMACPVVHCPVSGLHAVHHGVVLQRRKLSKGSPLSLRASPGTVQQWLTDPWSICGSVLEDSE